MAFFTVRTVEDFFAAQEGTMQLYRAIEQATRRLEPELAVDVIRSQVTLRRNAGAKGSFAAVWLPLRVQRDKTARHIVLTLFLGRRLSGERVLEARETYPGQWSNHLLVDSADLDEALLGQLAEAIARVGGNAPQSDAAR